MSKGTVCTLLLMSFHNSTQEGTMARPFAFLSSSSLIDEFYHVSLVGKMNMNDYGFTQYLLCIYQNYLNANFAYK